MKNFVAIVLFVLSFVAGAYGLTSPGPVLDQAKEAAGRGRSAESLSLFQKLQQSGYDSASLAYDIGVVALELKDYGTSIQQFRRAARSYPFKSQYLTLLSQARVMAGGGEELKPFTDLDFSTGQIRLFALVSVLLVVLLWATQWRIFFAALALLSLSLLGGAEYSIAKYNLGQLEVIAQHDKTEAFASPDSGVQAVEVVAAGAELKILDEQQGWFQVQLPSGRKGWLKESAGIVDPE